jgi:hypothetical protein
MQMVGSADRYVIARESNVVLVDFRRPDPPASWRRALRARKVIKNEG